MTSTALQVPSSPLSRRALDSLSRWASAIEQRAGRTSTAERVAAVAATTVALVAVLWVVEGRDAAGYLGIFALSMVASSMLFLPSGRVLILISGALILNPLAVAIVASVGGAIGESSGYFLGRCSNRVLKEEKTPAWLIKITDRRMGLAVLLGNLIPNPLVDAVSIMAGRVRYSLSKFLVYAIAGKVVQSTALVYLALWNIALVRSWLGLG